MVTEFSRSFLKDLDKINQASTKRNIVEIIEEVEKAINFSEIKNLKKLKGYAIAYRKKAVILG